MSARLAEAACACAFACAAACASGSERPYAPPPAPSIAVAPSVGAAPATAPSTTPSAIPSASAAPDADAGAPLDASADADANSPSPLSCPPDMAAVEGEYCTEVRQDCLVWMEPPVDDVGRCRKFAPSVCHGARVHKRFCIDVDEYTPQDQKLPAGHLSWTDGKRLCESMQKRLCLESEWNFACEGPEALPYPTGYERPAGKCNFDQMKLLDEHGLPRDLRKPSASLTECVSPFGVRNMVGNIDEWTFRDVMNGPNRTALKGGWWMAARNRCRPATTAHGELYRDFQSGLRCCADGR